MANCSVCGAKIGILESSELLDEKYNYIICSKCSDMKTLCNSSNVEIFSKGYNFFLARKDEIKDGEFSKVLNEFLINSKQCYNDRINEEKEEQVKTEREEAEKRRIIGEQQKEIEEYNRKLSSFMCTTSNGFEGYVIEKYIDIYCGEIVLGTGIFSELNAAFNDFLGENATGYESKIVKARDEAIKKLKEKCIANGANAVLGVSIDLTTIDKNMIVVCANGTAVIVKNNLERENNLCI